MPLRASTSHPVLTNLDSSTVHLPPLNTNVPTELVNLSSVPEALVPVDDIPPLPPPPIHPVTAILSRRQARPLDSPRTRTPYDFNSDELQTLYNTFSCRLWADRLRIHSLSLEGDQFITIAQEKYCTDLTSTASGSLLMWPYDDGTVTSTESNSLVSSITGPCYSRMNQPDHCVYTVIQPAQLMSLHLTTDSDISIVDDKTVQYFRVDVGALLMPGMGNKSA